MKRDAAEPSRQATKIAELEARCGELEAAAAGRAAFLAAVSHDIRDPMNGVLGMSRLLADTPLDPAQREYVAAICESSEALLTLVNDVLDLARIDAGRMELLDVDYDLLAMLERVRATFAPRARSKGLDFQFAVHGAAPKAVRGDPGRMRQVLNNLLGNALKFTDSGFLKLDAAFANAADGLEAKLRVEDSGVGLTASQAERVFSAFEQNGEDVRRLYGGSGLGLAISKRLSDMMGGALVAGPRAGGGAVFELALPLIEVSGAARSSDGVERSLVGATILIADPRDDTRRALRDLCSLWGMEARGVATGAQAVVLAGEAALRSAPFDFVVIDWELADGDGLELGAKFAADPNLGSPLAILSSAGGMRGDAAKARARGFKAYLQKPIDPEMLRAALLRLRGRPNGEFLTSHLLNDEQAPKRKVLLADDAPINCKLVEVMLRRAGHEVRTVHDGAAAVAALAEDDFDLVLMDLMMPEMDGLEATRAIRASSDSKIAKTPIVAITANAMRGDDAVCYEAGMNGYLTKPIDSARLLAAVDEYGAA